MSNKSNMVWDWMDYQKLYSKTLCEVLHKHKRKYGYTAEFIAEEIGANKKTVEAWLAGERNPQGGNLFALYDLFGVSFVADIHAPMGFYGIHKAGDSVSIESFHSSVSNTSALITKAREDGVIDHQEKNLIKHDLVQLISDAAACLAVMEGK